MKPPELNQRHSGMRPPNSGLSEFGKNIIQAGSAAWHLKG